MSNNVDLINVIIYDFVITINVDYLVLLVQNGVIAHVLNNNDDGY